MSALTLGLVALVMLGLHLLITLLAMLRYLRPAAPPATLGTPPVTLLRPVCGVDPFDVETLRSSFAQDYPHYEIVFCAQTPDDPAVVLVERLIAENPHVPARLLIGEAGWLRNPKLRNVWKGWHAARHDWICMTDSNLLLRSDYLSTVVGSWGDDTGLVSSPPVGIRPRNAAAHLECAFLNANQARLQLAADTLGNGFAQGKTLFFNRPLIEGAGGLGMLDRHLAEDVNATKLVRDLGRRVSLAPVPFAQPIGKRALRQVWDRQVRWARVRREGFPLLFLAEPLNGAMLPLIACAAAVRTGGHPLWWIGTYALVWYGAEAVLMRIARWPGSWRDLLALPQRDLLMPAIWLAALLRSDFTWRGTAMGGTGTPLVPLEPGE